MTLGTRATPSSERCFTGLRGHAPRRDEPAVATPEISESARISDQIAVPPAAAGGQVSVSPAAVSGQFAVPTGGQIAAPNGTRILVVDDNVRVRRSTAAALSRIGFHVMTAEDGAPKPR
jgi:hypothetical protein